MVSEERAHGSISTLTYLKYFKAGTNYLVLFAVFLVFILAEVSVCVLSFGNVFNVYLSCRLAR